jgi:hypothetical protein
VVDLKAIRSVAYGALLVAGLAAGTVGLSSSGPSQVHAETLQSPTTQLVSGITVQNLNASAAATVTIQFYDGSSSTTPGSEETAAAINTSIGPGQQQTWYTPTQTKLPVGFNGSAVVSASQPVAAIFNIQAPTSTGTGPSDPTRVTTNTGVNSSQVASTLFVPQLYKLDGGFTTSIAIQNAGGAPSTVTITYRDSFGNVIAGANDSGTVQPSSNLIVEQTKNSHLANNTAYSAVVTGGPTDRLAAIVLLNNQDTSSSNAQLLSYNAQAFGGTKLWAPRLSNNYYGFGSGLTIQNLDTSTPANVTISYSFACQGSTPSASPTQNLTINPEASSVLYLPNLSFIPSGNSCGKGAATITSNTNITALVNEDNRVNPEFIGQGTSYNAFVDGTQTGSAFMPQVTSRLSGFASGITIQNAGTSAASATVTINDPKASVTKSIQVTTPVLQPGGSYILFVPNAWTSPSVSSGDVENLNGSGIISSSQPMFALANISYRGDVDPAYTSSHSTPASAFGDSYAMYPAFNQ